MGVVVSRFLSRSTPPRGPGRPAVARQGRCPWPPRAGSCSSGALTVANPLTGASRALPPPPPPTPLQAVAMYGSPYRVVLILGKLTDLSMAAFDPSTNTWADAVPLSRKPDASPADAPATRGNNEGDDIEDVGDDGTVFFLSNSGAVVSCDLARRAFAELPRVLPAHTEHSIDVVACGARAYAVVLTEYLDMASLRVREFAGGAWTQAAAMPPAMSHGFYGAKADVNCVGHSGRIMVCVSSGEADGQNGSFMCDVASNRWEELPRCAGGDGGVTDFVAAFSFEPRMEVAV
ncbi:hypothetical protein ACQ4PT_026574 [Festuca glaucescens]